MVDSSPPGRFDALIASLDPEVREAVYDVDRSLIRLALEKSPRDRLRSASNMARTLTRFRRETSPSGRS